MADEVHLKAPSGVAIRFSLPLHATIDEQWRKGEMQRVTGDGLAWEGDEYDLDGAGPAAETPAEGGPSRPADSAAKKAWQDYAVSLGACTEDEAAGMTRADLIGTCTPPELDPLAGGS